MNLPTLLMFFCALASTARAEQTATPRRKMQSVPQATRYLPIVEGSSDCPDLRMRAELPMPLVRPVYQVSTQAELEEMRKEILSLHQRTEASIASAYRSGTLPELEPLAHDLVPSQVKGGMNLPRRDRLVVAEYQMASFLALWLEVFAGNGDPVIAPTDSSRQVKVCFGFYPGGSQDLMVTNSDGWYQVAIGLGDYSRYAQPGTNEYLQNYAALGHEFGHLLLALGKRSAAGKAEELRADCVSGVLLGAILKTSVMDLRRARIGRAFASWGDFAVRNRRHHGTPTERMGAAMAGFDHGSAIGRTPSIGRTLKSADIVNFCANKY
jgi:hypothetical protein